MKKMKKTNIFIATGTLILAVLFVALGIATDPASADTEKTGKQVEKTQQDQTAEKRKEILNEASSAIRETQNALKALDEKKNKDALVALERATGKLEIILARDPELALAPSGINAFTYDVLADIDAVKALRKKAEDALEDGRVQEARRLISNLASETVIRVSNIPLATYPDAIKLAVKRIDEGDIDEAQKILQTALNTLVMTDTIIPLPVIRAEKLLKEAETLVEKEDRKEEENERLTGLLKDARIKLEFAQALGYGSKKDFKNLYEQLDEIEDKTGGSKSGTGFFDKIKRYLKDTLESSQKGAQSGKDK